MEFFIHSFLSPTLHRSCYLSSLSSKFTRGQKPPGPSKFEMNTTQIGEGLGLFMFDLWIAA